MLNLKAYCSPLICTLSSVIIFVKIYVQYYFAGYLEFIEPGFSINQVENGDDTYSTAIYATDPIVLGSSYDPHTERNVYVRHNTVQLYS